MSKDVIRVLRSVLSVLSFIVLTFAKSPYFLWLKFLESGISFRNNPLRPRILLLSPFYIMVSFFKIPKKALVGYFSLRSRFFNFLGVKFSKSVFTFPKFVNCSVGGLDVVKLGNYFGVAIYTVLLVYVYFYFLEFFYGFKGFGVGCFGSFCFFFVRWFPFLIFFVYCFCVLDPFLVRRDVFGAYLFFVFFLDFFLVFSFLWVLVILGVFTIYSIHTIFFFLAFLEVLVAWCCCFLN